MPTPRALQELQVGAVGGERVSWPFVDDLVTALRSALSWRGPTIMKVSAATRPCAEFPCDNPQLHAGAGALADLGEASDPAAEVCAPPTDDVHGAGGDEFDWAATEYWVKELKRRWSLAKADAPEIRFPVLDEAALESIAGDAALGRPTSEITLALEEPALATDSALVLGELLVMPSETVFEHDPYAPESALTFDLAEMNSPVSDPWCADVEQYLESGDIPLVLAAQESGVEAVSVESTSADVAEDPFIQELLTLMPQKAHESADPSSAHFDAFIDALGRELDDQCLEIRSVPNVAANKPAPPSETNELIAVPHAAQALVPLQLELTPTPAALSPWSELTGALARHLMNGGHTRAAALVTPLLCGELVDFGRIEAVAVERLVAEGVAERRGGRVVATTAFRHAARTFREEFFIGGLNASDALFWLSQLLVALCGGGLDEEVLESELRQIGVAKLLERAA